MKVVVTGALGHIGSKLVRVFPENIPDVEIVMIDNLSSQRYCSLFNLPPRGRYRFIEDDIMKADLAPVFSGADAVIHLAAITDATSSFDNANEVEEVNFVGTEKVARACAETGSSMIFLSTTSVYGAQRDVVDENCPIEDLKPQSPYAEAKLKSEQLLKALNQTDGLNFVTLRFGTIFGISPGMRFHTAVNKFVWQACLGRPVTVWRTALNQKRPYLDLNDAVQSLFFVLKHHIFDNDIYNVVTVNSSVGEIVDIIRTHVPDVKIEYVDTRIMNQLSYNVDDAKFRALGFEISGNLNDGVQQSIAVLRNVRSC